MAEQKGFFRRIFSFGTDDEARRMPDQSGEPRPSDTEVGREDAPDPDARPKAAAHSVADTEAGASVEDGGGITPLTQGKEDTPSDDAAEGGMAEKKTP